MQVTALHENCQCALLHDSVSIIDTRDMPCSSVSSRIRHVQCTCRSVSASLAQRSAYMCHHGSKPETLMPVGQPVNNAVINTNYYQHCCTCIASCSQHPAMLGCHHTLIAASVWPGCTKFTQMNRPDQLDTASRHCDINITQQEQDRMVNSSRAGQSGNVVVDVNEWQRQHYEHLDRQKLEVCVTLYQCVFLELIHFLICMCLLCQKSIF